MEDAFGGSDAAGLWDWKTAYDAGEVALILFLRRYGKTILRKSASPHTALARFEALARLLPSHTRRSETSQALQQFSTPAGLGFVVAAVAAIRPGDLVLEPSAGTGLLAIHAELAGARLALNELGEVRSALLAELFAGTAVTRHDAAQLHDHLPPAIRPTVVLMNPPFSAVPNVARTMRDAAMRHIASALARLEPGGRLVAITGAGCSPHVPAWADAFARLQEHGRILFSAAIDGSAYARHGTTTETRLTVIDKVPAPDPHRFPASPGTAPDTATLLTWVLGQLPPRDPESVAMPCVQTASGAGLASLRAARLPSGRCEPMVIPPARETPDSVELGYEALDWAPAPERLTEGLYEPYALQSLHIPGARPHPTPLVQSAAMASVAPPRPG